MLAEPIQTVMRRYGIADPYEQLKALTRGQQASRAKLLHAFIRGLDIPEADKAALLALTPATYTRPRRARSRGASELVARLIIRAAATYLLSSDTESSTSMAAHAIDVNAETFAAAR